MEENNLQEDEKKEENLLPFNLMKSKIASLSKNDEFKKVLKGARKNNKYFTIFFKKLSNKNNEKLKKSFIPKKK